MYELVTPSYVEQAYAVVDIAALTKTAGQICTRLRRDNVRLDRIKRRLGSVSPCGAGGSVEH
jgi:hypothetical protein